MKSLVNIEKLPVRLKKIHKLQHNMLIETILHIKSFF